MKKGNTWHFGYKAHIGVDRDSGLVHTVEATAANVHDATETSRLLTGDEDEVYGDRHLRLPRSRKARRCDHPQQGWSQDQIQNQPPSIPSEKTEDTCKS